jgi:hypothetical protein
LREIPAVRGFIVRVDPRRRRREARWRLIDRHVDYSTVDSGPFAGMSLGPIRTGSHIPKRLGSYERELHPLIETWTDYDRVIDVGCGEGWYVVGLARRMPAADIWGFDTSSDAQDSCRETAALNKVRVHVAGTVTALDLGRLVSGRTLVIVDAEGAEVDLLDPAQAPGLKDADILVEMHDFLRAGATATIRQRFADRACVEIAQEPRSAADYPALLGLDEQSQARALDESRAPDQVWLWLPAAPAVS